MSRIKHWMMSMDQAIDEALFFDLKGDDILKYVHIECYPVDDEYVKQRIKDICGE